MSDSGKAVFLSYASQDAEAAKRICDALRAAGVEVWFDQNELVGGDAWDAKIRKQIRECALLIPVISKTTQGRREAYFRLEWKLADERTHLMAKGTPFLLPVTIDGTGDRDALVPDSFLAVQWTKLPGGEGGSTFAARVQKLLGASEKEAERPRPAERGEVAPLPKGPRLGPWLALGGVAVVVLGLSIARPWQHSGPPPPASAKKPAAPLSEARKLANQAMQLLEDPNFTRETSWLADELCQRALALDAADAEVWAVASFASHNLFLNTYDTSASRREKARSQAERASQLDPSSVRAALAVARSLEGTGNDAEVLRMLRELHGRAPEDQQVIFSLLRAEGRQQNEAAVQGLLAKLRALPRTGLLPLALWFQGLRLRTAGRYAEAEAIQDEMLAGPEVLRGAYYEKLNVLMRSWHELTEAGRFIDKIPARFRQEPSFGSAIAYYWLWRAEPEKALQALALVSQDYFEEYAAREPKGYLTGWAHAAAGRSAAAQAEWRNALAVVEERLKSDGRNFTLLNQRALLLALTGQREAAREAWQLRVELGGTQNIPGFEAESQVFLALNEPEAAITALERDWARLSPGGRCWRLPNLRHHPAFAAVRGDPRVQLILSEGMATLQELKAQQTGAIKPALAAPADDKSVAVLAFANLSDDKNNEYFSDGISEELLNVLAKVPGLKVSARTSAFYFKGKEVPVPEIAKQLGVAYVVEGSVRKAGDKVRITAQLIKAADGFHVWSDTFTRDLKDIFAVQDEIAGLVAKNLSLKLGLAPVAASGAAVPTQNLAAYDLYLRGRAAQTGGGGSPSGLEAVRLYEEALRLDPGYALASARLAQVFHSFRVNGYDRSEQTAAQARNAALTAVRLDPNLPEAHLALALVRQSIDYDLGAAQRELDEAERLRPNDPEAPAVRLELEFARGHWGDALVALAARAAELDPRNTATLQRVGLSLKTIGRFAQADRCFEQSWALSQESSNPLRFRALNYLEWTGDLPGAMAMFEAIPETFSRGMLFSLNHAGLHAMDGKFPAAIAAYEQVRTFAAGERATTSGPRGSQIIATIRLGQLEARLGRGARAAELYTEALAASRQYAQDLPDLAGAPGFRAIIHALRGEKSEARAALAEATQIAARTHDAFAIAGVRRTNAEMLALLGETAAAIAELRAVHEQGYGFGYLLRLQLEWEPLRGDAKFQQLMQEAEARADAQRRPKK